MNLTGRTFKSFKLKKQGWIKDIIQIFTQTNYRGKIFCKGLRIAQRLKSMESLNYT